MVVVGHAGAAAVKLPLVQHARDQAAAIERTFALAERYQRVERRRGKGRGRGGGGGGDLPVDVHVALPNGRRQYAELGLDPHDRHTFNRKTRALIEHARARHFPRQRGGAVAWHYYWERFVPRREQWHNAFRVRKFGVHLPLLGIGMSWMWERGEEAARPTLRSGLRLSPLPAHLVTTSLVIPSFFSLFVRDEEANGRPESEIRKPELRERETGFARYKSRCVASAGFLSLSLPPPRWLPGTVEQRTDATRTNTAPS